MSDSKNRLKLLNWNIQWGKGTDNIVDLNRLVKAIKQQDPDIITLQEVSLNFIGNTKGAKSNQICALIDLLNNKQNSAYHYNEFGPADDRRSPIYGKQQFGNLTISKHPIIDVRNHRLPMIKYDANLTDRSALETLIKTPIGHIRIINTHLTYVDKSSSQHKQLKSIQNKQFNYLKTRIKELKKYRYNYTNTSPSDPKHQTPLEPIPNHQHIILCGDFNSVPSKLKKFTLKINFIDTGSNHPLIHEDTVPNIKSSYQPTCFDYILISPSLKSSYKLNHLVDKISQASDHQFQTLELT